MTVGGYHCQGTENYFWSETGFQVVLGVICLFYDASRIMESLLFKGTSSRQNFLAWTYLHLLFGLDCQWLTRSIEFMSPNEETRLNEWSLSVIFVSSCCLSFFFKCFCSFFTFSSWSFLSFLLLPSPHLLFFPLHRRFTVRCYFGRSSTLRWNNKKMKLYVSDLF